MKALSSIKILIVTCSMILASSRHLGSISIYPRSIGHHWLRKFALSFLNNIKCQRPLPHHLLVHLKMIQIFLVLVFIFLFDRVKVIVWSSVVGLIWALIWLNERIFHQYLWWALLVVKISLVLACSTYQGSIDVAVFAFLSTHLRWVQRWWIWVKMLVSYCSVSFFLRMWILW